MLSRSEKGHQVRPILRVARKILDWVVILFGLLVGSFALGGLGTQTPPSWGEADRWFNVCAVALFAFSLIIGSLVTLRSRKQAALLCLFGLVACMLKLFYDFPIHFGFMTDYLPVDYYRQENASDWFDWGVVAPIACFPIIGSIVAYRKHLKTRFLYL